MLSYPDLSLNPTSISSHRLQNRPSTEFTEKYIIVGSIVLSSYPVHCHSADHIVRSSLHAHKYELTNE